VNQALQTREAKGFTWIKHPEYERRGDLRKSSTPNVRGEETHVNQASRTW